MRNGSYSQISPEAVAQKLPEARALFHAARIDTTSRMRLSDAAMASGENIDELLAVLEDRARRHARHAHHGETAPAVVTHEEAFALV